MTATSNPPPPPTGAEPAPAGLPGRGGRTRVPLLLLGLLIMLGSGLGFAVWSADLGERETVLVAADSIGAGEVVTDADLRSAALGGATDVDTLPESARGSLIGTTAVSDISEGTVLNADMFVEGVAVDEGEAVVGVSLDPGAIPVPDLRPNDRVLVVGLTGGSGSGGESGSGGSGGIAEARVLASRLSTDTSNTVTISLVVDEDDAVAVARAAGNQSIWLVLQP